MDNQVRPTKKQRQMLAFLEAFINEYGYSPSYREMMGPLGYTSVATVALHVNNLIKRGHLRKREHSARSLEIVKPTQPVSQPITSNQVKMTEEKWLIGKVEHYFTAAEESDVVLQADLDALYVLVGALKILGLDGAAQGFSSRLTLLKKKLPGAQS